MLPFRTFFCNLSWHQGISIKIALQHSANFLDSCLTCKGRFDWDIIWLSKLETRICSLSFQNVSLKKLLHKLRKQNVNCGFQSNGLPPPQRFWTPLWKQNERVVHTKAENVTENKRWSNVIENQVSTHSSSLKAQRAEASASWTSYNCTKKFLKRVVFPAACISSAYVTME